MEFEQENAERLIRPIEISVSSVINCIGNFLELLRLKLWQIKNNKMFI